MLITLLDKLCCPSRIATSASSSALRLRRLYSLTRLWPFLGKAGICLRLGIPPSANLSLISRGLQLVALIDPIVPIFDGLLGFVIHLNALQLP